MAQHYPDSRQALLKATATRGLDRAFVACMRAQLAKQDAAAARSHQPTTNQSGAGG